MIQKNKMIFIDTEFTDFMDPHLISIGFVADTNEEFYVELPYLLNQCSAFVQEAVVPLLGREPGAACERDEFQSKIIIWLEFLKSGDQKIDICFDCQTDWDLFAGILDYRVPPWVHPCHVGRNINELFLYNWYKASGLPRHHALYDARANRYAYRYRPPVTSG